MTCDLSVRCVLCEPPTRIGFALRLPSPYWVKGNLAYEMAHPGRQSKMPHLEFCPGCLQRIGVAIPAAGRLT